MFENLAEIVSIEDCVKPSSTIRQGKSHFVSQNSASSVLILLCHKMLARFDVGLSVVEILTRGGGLWVSNPSHVAANHASPLLSRRSRQCLAMPIAPHRSDRIARDCCCRVIAKALSRWPRARNPGGCRPPISHCITSWRTPIGLTWAVHAAVRARVLPIIDRRSPIRALIIDETGMPKKSEHSVGVARQYCGQLGKQDNCQVAVSPSAANGHASSAFRHVHVP
jgi:hypothetical protein